MGNREPIKKFPYRAPLTKRKAGEKTQDGSYKKMLESMFCFVFPIVLLDMKGGRRLFCVNFRALNRITRTNDNPPPGD